MQCSLCKSKAELFFQNKNKEYYICSTCAAVTMNSDNFLSVEQEIIRYQEHHNDVTDIRYQTFVNPIVKEVLNDFNKEAFGLDFGCGTGPVISKLLRDQNYNVATYDPFFDNNVSALKKCYDFIVCCEVIEHFHNPLKEFKLLKSLLESHGKLYCMTDLYHPSIDFDKWYYKNDDTHVIFYQEKTFEWIKEQLGFSNVTNSNRLIVFEN